MRTQGVGATVWVVGSLLTVVATDARGQFVFEQVVNVAVVPNSYPATVAAGDLNKDGEVDIVVAARSATQAQIMFGGPGGPRAPVPLPVGFETNAVVTGDFDRDGWLDLAFTDRSSGRVRVFRNAGQGNFGTYEHYTILPSAFWAVCADLTADGYLDLVVTHTGISSTRMSVLLNAGDGTLVPAPPIEAGANQYYADDGDLDGDGDLDIVAGGDEETIVVTNNGGGSFSVSKLSTIPVSCPSPVLSDLDGDDLIDIASTARRGPAYPAYISVRRNLGDGVFSPQQLISMTNVTWSDPWHTMAGDFDGDGLGDLIEGNNSGTIGILRNTTKAQISFSQPVLLPTDIGFTYSGRVLDIDSDCDFDIIAANIDAATVSVFRNLTDQGSNCTPADLNGDGTINGPDLMAVLDLWSSAGTNADLNYSGRVEVHDLLYLLAVW
jgi:hypothetical protein